LLENYLVIALRNLYKHKVYSLINILGLATGIAFFTLLVLIIRYELSYDDIHRFKNRIYRVVKFTESTGLGEKTATVPFPLGPSLMQQYPEQVESYVRIFNFQVPTHSISRGNTRKNEPHFYFADASFFDVFDFPIAMGNPERALQKPMGVIISQRVKEVYFGDGNPIGKQLLYEEEYPFVVTGVFAEKDYPTHFEFDFIASMASLTNLNVDPQMLESDWRWDPCWTYVLLEDDKSPEDLEFLLEDLVGEKFPQAIRQQTSLFLQPLKEIHLYSSLSFELGANSDVRYVFIFGALAILILVIATVNFTNLSSAKAALRSREIGIRKAIGADQAELIRQFVVEFLLISSIAILFAFILLELMLPLFAGFSDSALHVYTFDKRFYIVTIIASGLSIGLFSSLFPTYYIARFQPSEALTGSMMPNVKSKRFRSILVVVQFVITGFLLVTTFTSMRQFYFLKTANLGFEKKNILVVPVANTDIRFRFNDFKDRLLASPHIRSVTASEEVLGLGHRSHDYRAGIGGHQPEWMFFPSLMVRADFLDVFDIELLAGNGFSGDENQEAYRSVVVNEEMVKYMGWGTPQQAIGKTLSSRAGGEKVIGVAKNFNFESLHNEVAPFVIDIPSDKFQFWFTRYVSVRVEEGKQDVALKYLSEVWNDFVPKRRFEHFVLSRELARQYKQERNLGSVLSYFALVALLIACLGLYGLSSFVVNLRKKEVAIRKAIGTTDFSIFLLLLRDFFGLVGIAILLAMPIAWLVMSSWLENFPFHTSVHIGDFIVTLIVAFTITLLTVSYHTVRAALRPPTKSLQGT